MGCGGDALMRRRKLSSLGLALLAGLFVAQVALAQVTLAPVPVMQFFDNNGNLLTGGELFTYLGGTTTKALTYTDSTGQTANPDPTILNARGEAQVWIPPGQAYKFVLAPPNSSDPPTNPFWTVDGVTIGAQTASGFTLNVACSNPTASPTITCTADQLVLAPALGSATTILSNYSQNFSGTTIGAGGMDTGSVPASGWLCLYAISGPAGTSILGTNCTMSSGTIYSGSHLPAGYNSSVLLAPLPTTGSSTIAAVYVRGRHADEANLTALNTTSPAGSPTSLGISCCAPPNALEVSGTLSAFTSTSNQTALLVGATSALLGLKELAPSSANAFAIDAPFDVDITIPQTIFYETQPYTGTYEIFISGYKW